MIRQEVSVDTSHVDTAQGTDNSETPEHACGLRQHLMNALQNEGFVYIFCTSSYHTIRERTNMLIVYIRDTV